MPRKLHFSCLSAALGLTVLAPLLPAQNASLVGAYTFQNTLNSSFGGSPALEPTDPLGRSGYMTDTVLGQTRTVYRFEGTPTQQAGLSLSTNGVLNPQSYSLEMLFAFTEGNNQFRRVYETLDRTTDRGLYINQNNNFEFSRLSRGTFSYPSGQYVHMVLTVTNNQAMLYINGTRDINLGTDSMNINNPRRIVHFFLDNLEDTSRNDYSSGKIALLRTYTNALTAAEAATLARDPFNSSVGIGPPAFSASGVRNGASFSEATPVAPGAFFSIFGSSLSSATGDWSAGFSGGQAPTRLNGTRVFVNDREASVVFTSPGQVNALAPDFTAGRTVTVRVENNGVSSPAVTVDSRALNPTFFTYDQRNRRFIAALNSTNDAYIAPSDLFGVSTLNGLRVRPARPGEFVIAYGMGMGATNPTVAAGRIPPVREGGHPLAGTVTLRFGNRNITPVYAGLSSFAGVYIVGFQVPADLPEADYELQITINDVSSPTGVVIAVAP